MLHTSIAQALEAFDRVWLAGLEGEPKLIAMAAEEHASQRDLNVRDRDEFERERKIK